MPAKKKAKPKKKDTSWDRGKPNTVHMKNTWISFGIPPGMKDALERHATNNGTTMSDVARSAVAVAIGYDLDEA